MRTLFVGGLPPTASEELLESIFGRFGPLAGTRLATREDSGECRGFGFVTFVDGSDATRALGELDGQIHEGIRLRVDRAR